MTAIWDISELQNNFHLTSDEETTILTANASAMTSE